MADFQVPLKGHKVGVIGFNARPLACSALKAGATVYVSDYWGDSDLTACCHKWASVLQPEPGRRQREKLEKPVQLSLVDNMLALIEGLDVDYLLVGSGFDDCPEVLTPLHELVGIVGNSPKAFQRARNTKLLQDASLEHGACFPERYEFKNYHAALAGCNKIAYPCVIRPKTSGGGAGIILANTDADVGRFFKKGIDQPREGVVQQYIQGLDISCSVLSTGTDALSISCQGQLIGIPSAGRNCDFAFCGNYSPVPRRQEVLEFARSTASKICMDMSLTGSNGVDMVLDSQSQLWVLEVNPRFQGTLELLELAGKISVTSLHHESCSGRLPEHSFSYSPAVKMIVYSLRNGAVSDLSGNPNVVDRTPPGVYVNRGDPICSVITTGSSLKESYSQSCSVAVGIQRSVSQ
ncbi:MAG: ATP-grasp domain-containing protein [Candidatus Thorarchaeota archaeon]|nr:ATP-grasp domain-containing protein [Candidatus Thorarchaeota archaeon]